jgi:autotransporter family porin
LSSRSQLVVTGLLLAMLALLLPAEPAAANHRYGYRQVLGTTETGKATTRPVGSAPLSDAEAATRVRRSSWEPRPENVTMNRRVPSATELAHFRSLNTTPAAYRDKVTGNFTGTTDEIIQWAAHKWGIDEDLVRAQAVKESWWKMTTLGDGGISYGLMQVKSTVSKGTYPLSQQSTAFNVDYYGASMRNYFDGAAMWLNDPCCFSGKTYGAGDIWGSAGAWFAGRWYNVGAVDYINSVKNHLSMRTWSRTGF